VQDGWVISGGPWTFGSYSLWAPFTNLGCIADDGGEPRLVAIQVPLDELRFLDDWQVAGMRGTGSVSITLAEGELSVPGYRGADFRDIASGPLENGLKGSSGRRQRPARLSASWRGCRSASRRAPWSASSRPLAGDPFAAPRTRVSSRPALPISCSLKFIPKTRSATLMTRANAEYTDHFGALAAAGIAPTPGYAKRSVPGFSWRPPMRPNGARRRSRFSRVALGPTQSSRASRFNAAGATGASSPCTARSISRPCWRTMDD